MAAVIVSLYIVHGADPGFVSEAASIFKCADMGLIILI